jgi:hypothetical protein
MARLVPIVGAVAAALFGNFFFEVVAAAGRSSSALRDLYD